ncbi:YIL089W [Saccharomyces arboricola H-6]|uniref:YIL089W n=1 Tax=Saccharomyces arboricola (strain H-6 / AS 2.3317 / CBS 10644) TaxID=1160507 RepID=J8PMH0_SACAR|nr:YIL089W [Saccharomyces arboricola H-6]
MENSREIESGIVVNPDESPRSKFFLIVEKLSKVADIVYVTDAFIIPPLYPLKERYPKVVQFAQVQSILDLISVLIFFTYEILLLGNSTFEKQFEREPKKCSKSVCSHCTGSKQHPNWFKIKHLLLCIGTSSFGIYSFVKIHQFFKTDDTVNLERLLWLFGWQLNALLNMKLFSFYGRELDAHSMPVGRNDDPFDKQPLLGSKMV